MRLTLTPAAGWISNRVITGPGCTDSTMTSTPNSLSLISSSRDIASSDSGEYCFCCFSATSSRESGGRLPSISGSTKRFACFSFITRLLCSTALGGAGGVITGATRFSRSLMCLFSDSSRSSSRSFTRTRSRRSGREPATSLTTSSASRSWATSCLRSARAFHQRLKKLWISSSRSSVILPVRSITLNQDRSVKTVRPNRKNASNNRVLPCTLSAASANCPRLSPSAPPADAGR